MWSKQDQQHSLENYLTDLLDGAQSALWDDGPLAAPPVQPTPKTKSKRVSTRTQDRASRKTQDNLAALALPPRDAVYIHLQPLSVVGLQLLLARSAVSAIIPWPMPDPGACNEFFGGERSRTATVGKYPKLRVIDTARLVVPSTHPRYDDLVSRRVYGNIIVLAGGQWGLACESIDEEIMLPGNSVCWRDNSTQEHPWLAATFSEYGYALIDASRMIRLA